MTALRFQTGGRHQTSPASLRGAWKGEPLSSWFSTERSLISASAVPHCGVCTMAWEKKMSSRAHLHVLGMLRFMFLTYTNRACPLLFIRSIFVSFCLYCPFTCISFHKFSQQLSAFSLCSSGLISALLVLSTIYLFLEVSFSPGKILCGWLGLKHQLTNRLKYPSALENWWKLALPYAVVASFSIPVFPSHSNSIHCYLLVFCSRNSGCLDLKASTSCDVKRCLPKMYLRNCSSHV